VGLKFLECSAISLYYALLGLLLLGDFFFYERLLLYLQL
jgi:hypothetical protein